MYDARYLAIGLAMAVALPCLGQPGPEDDSDRLPQAEVSLPAPGPECRTRRRLGFHEPLYGLYKFTEGDDDAIRLHYSFKYTLTEPGCELTDASGKVELRAPNHEIFVSYTGEFDFYVGSRESGPVINRISNPALHYRYFGTSRFNAGWRWLDLGVEHRSTGQTTDPEDTVGGVYRTQIEDAAGNHAYFDSLSQDTNFVSLDTRYDVKDWLRLWARWKVFYFANKVEVTYGPHQGAEVQDYDRVRLTAGYRISAKTRVRDEWWLYGEWTVGDKGLKTDSLDVSAYLPFKLWIHWPLYIRAHFGPNEILSDFTRERNSIGFGFQFLD
jgi:hypothetical protein